MKIASLASCLCGLFLFAAATPRSSASPPPKDAALPPANTAQLARGEYLVKHTSMCDDCHTEHDAQGRPIKADALKGASLTFTPKGQLPNSIWSDVAPSLVGLNFFTDEQAMVFFTTAKTPDGKFARAPMPQYTFSKSDAAALIAYLKSLPAK